MITINVDQGGNQVTDVYVAKNKHGVIDIVINYDKRWCEWTTGCSYIDGEQSEDFLIYNVDHDMAGEPFTKFGDITEVHICHDGELNNLHQVTTQCKDQLHVLYIPYELVTDGELLAEWEREE